MNKAQKDYPNIHITEIIPNGFLTVDANWNITSWNLAAEQLIGVQAKEVLGKNIWTKLGHIIPKGLYETCHQKLMTSELLNFSEYWTEMKDWFNIVTCRSGDSLAISFNTGNNRSQNAYPGYSVEKLINLNELYRFVTEVTNDCFWDWNMEEKQIFWIDGGHKRVFGYPIENTLIPQSFWEGCIHPGDKSRVNTKLSKAMADGVLKWEDEYRFKKADGQYAYVFDRACIVYDSAGIASRIIGATQDITEKKLLQQNLVDERLKQQKEIIRAVLSARMIERTEIGKELHDNLSQILGATKLYIETAKNNDENSHIYLEKSTSLISDVITEIRRISKSLILPDLVLGLTESINLMIDELALVDPIKIFFHSKGFSDTIIDKRMQVDIFRIIQEQVNNVIKHAKASFAAIYLTRHSNDVHLLISDNGRGCDVTTSRDGIGLLNIQNRADCYQGSVTIESNPGEGYDLNVELKVTS